MGGNALKHLQPVRLTSAEVIDVVHHLHRNWQFIDVRPLYLVPWVAEKADHGDIDLICEAEPASVRHFAERLGIDPAVIIRNDSVLSVPVPLPWDVASAHPRIVQVDFLCCTPEEAPAMRFFYAGGDFGMMLGRIAAWMGLVFGMDGLRYRAERDVPWATDILLTAQPAEVLRALGYAAALPWFDTYDTLWRFILSSPLAGPWMFMPEATNADNRSRDKQRRKIGDFQAWLVDHFPDQLEPPRPRVTAAEARAWVRAHFPAIDIDGIVQRQEARFTYAKLRTRLLGMGAVEDILGPGYPHEALGDIVRAMQDHLPDKTTREAAMAEPAGWVAMISAARAAAGMIADARGLARRDPPPVPAYLPPS